MTAVDVLRAELVDELEELEWRAYRLADPPVNPVGPDALDKWRALRDSADRAVAVCRARLDALDRGET